MRKIRTDADYNAYCWSLVDQRGPDDCWLWLGSRTPLGYGQVERLHKNRRASRVIFELANGPFDQKLHVLHRCDNPPCCNPAHLFLGTPMDNKKDCIAKGRDRKALGPDNFNAKPDADKVREIRMAYRWGGNIRRLAALFGVTRSTIYHVIVRKHVWLHVA